MRLFEASRQCFPRPMSQCTLRTPPFGLDFGEPKRRRSLLCDDDEVDPRGHEVGPQPEALTAHALHAVPFDSATNFLRHHEPEPGWNARITKHPRDEEDEVRARRTPRACRGRRSVRPTRLNTLKIRVPTDLTAPREGEAISTGAAESSHAASRSRDAYFL
jgi:hypothetical protein